MCSFTIRVFSCGHYTKSLRNPCGPAKKKQEVCDSGSEDSKTTGMYCSYDGCDKKAGGRREGPSKCFTESTWMEKMVVLMLKMSIGMIFNRCSLPRKVGK